MELVYFSFNINKFLFVFAVTIFLAANIIKKQPLEGKVFFLLQYSFCFLYEGIGASNDYNYDYYYLYYSIYLLFYTIGVKIVLASQNKKSIVTNLKDESFYDGSDIITIKFINKYGGAIICIYFLCVLSNLIYPVFKLGNLFHPQLPDLTSFALRFQGEGSKSGLTSLIYLIENILLPFFLISLYKFRNNIKILSLLVVLITYIRYCNSGYISRSTMMILAIFFFFLLFFYNPDKRKKMIRILIVSIPLVLVFLGAYQIIRQGNSASGFTYAELIKNLLLCELDFPSLFEPIFRAQWEFTNFSDYFAWLIELPLPGGLKIGNFDAGINYKISELATGSYRGDDFFSVALGGLVTEGYYILGRLFFLHGFLLGIIMSAVYKYVFSHKSYIVLATYYMAYLTMATARGGTSSTYPMIFKHLIIFILFMWLYERNSMQKTNHEYV